MREVTKIGSRKAEHIRINLEENVQSGLTTGLERYHFQHRALPELNMSDVDTSLNLFGRNLRTPILISSMTGGTDQAGVINQTLAEAAQATGAAMGLGSQRAALEQPELASTFQVRKVAPDVLLFANLGAIQLNYGFTIDHCRRAVEMIDADVLILHFNAVQEALQPEGNTNFAGLLSKVEQICRQIHVPVIAKEVGWGFSEKDVVGLRDAGIQAIDVAGAGGTSWSQVEKYRTADEDMARLAEAFIDWGIPTSEAIQIVRKAAPELIVIASGGLRSGIDIAKCIALGASLGGMASPFLKAAVQSLDQTINVIGSITREIRTVMFAAGIANLKELEQSDLLFER
jgi:isopentenyl-diphosphate delta-isomerase